MNKVRWMGMAAPALAMDALASYPPPTPKRPPFPLYGPDGPIRC
ncbi:hypothetical protein [Sandarakinorhabdus sp. AAP62]|nr:hypothetical protein [Sandarakinorhabdus sp. AAP62]